METTPWRQLPCANNSELENPRAQSGGSSSIGFLDCQDDELQTSERKGLWSYRQGEWPNLGWLWSSLVKSKDPSRCPEDLWATQPGLENTDHGCHVCTVLGHKAVKTEMRSGLQWYLFLGGKAIL